MSKYDFKKFILCTVIPFVLPFINVIPDSFINQYLKIILISVFLIIDLLFVFEYYKQENQDRIKSLSDKIKYEAYSNAYELSERKRDYLIGKSYIDNFSISKEKIPYDVHDYIAEICKNFRDVISQITSIGKEYMSVTFIYHYVNDESNSDDQKWRWVVGKESTTQISLDSFINNNKTLYSYLLKKDTNVNSVFCNDKKKLEKESHYHMSKRDIDHDKTGSVFAVKVFFGNNATSFVESVLLVSTYGKQFIEGSNAKCTEMELKNLLLEELFPYYQRLLEAELGVLYLRHKSNK